MSFASLTFALFYAVVFALYWWSRNRTAQNALILVASYLFYAWWDYRFCGLMLLSATVDYAAARAMARGSRHTRRIALLVSLSVNLGLLGFFKYFNFFIDSLIDACSAIGVTIVHPSLRVVLPVGISFYTFQTMSYTLDVYARRLAPAADPIAYGAYVSFFPQLVAGPIERGAHLLPQFLQPRRFNRAAAVDGCRQALWGLFKKMVLADNLAPVVDVVFSDVNRASAAAIALATVLFAFQIYLDFSAYSDIAVGTARLLGFDLMRNFAYPYFASSLGEFWHRWHISLSTWFRDYLYIPLGGSRQGPLRTAANVLATFTLSGLWHGAAWNFVAWGMLNGLLLLIARGSAGREHAPEVPGGERGIPRPAQLLRMLRTFLMVCVLWVFFRAQGLDQAVDALTRMAMLAPSGLSANAALDRSALGPLLAPLLYALIMVEWVARRHPHPLQLPGWPSFLRWGAYTSLLWMCLYWGTNAAGEFIYFQF